MSLQVSDLTVSFANKTVLKNINFCLESKLYSIIGPNGAGKTTLLKALGSLIPTQGSITYNTIDIKQNSLKQNAKIIALMSQFQATPPLLVEEFLTLGRRPHSGYRLCYEDKQIITQIVDKLQLHPYLHRNLQHLSGGERQKIYLAKALIQKPRILLLDEPISHLDPKNQMEILEIVKKVTYEQDLITVIVLHDLQNALHYSDEILMLKQGSLLYKTPAKEVEERMFDKVFDIECKIFKNQGHPFVLLHHKHQDAPHLQHSH